MPAPVAHAMADGQVLQVAATALALGADVFQRGVFGGHMLAADPAGHLPMQLAGHGVVNLGAGEGEAAHTGAVAAELFSGGRLSLPASGVGVVIHPTHPPGGLPMIQNPVPQNNASPVICPLYSATVYDPPTCPMPFFQAQTSMK